MIFLVILALLNCRQLVTLGSLRAQFDQNGKIDVLDLVTTEHNEYIPRTQLQVSTDSPDPKHSPKASKTMGKQRSQQRHQQPPQAQTPLPISMVNEYGMTDAVMRFLEVHSLEDSYLCSTY